MWCETVNDPAGFVSAATTCTLVDKAQGRLCANGVVCQLNIDAGRCIVI